MGWLGWSIGGKEELAGKVVMVTGASSGIGRELAVALNRKGARLLLAARSTDRLLELREELLATGCGEVEVITLDLEDLLTLQDKAVQARQVWGRVDILVNNGGVSVRGGALETKLEVHKRLMDINYFGAVELTRHLAPHMISQGGGTVVNVSSLQGKLAVPHRAAYAASKHALQAWSDSLRAEVSSQGVSVILVCPGYVRTQLSSNALTGEGGRHGEMDPSTAQGYCPIWVAERVVQAMESGQQEVVLAPLHHRLALLLRVLLPSLYFWLMARRAGKAGE